MRISALIRLWRRQNGLTLRAAARKIGVTASTLHRIERGEQMHGVTLATLLVWLMGREEPSANETFTFDTKHAAPGKEEVIVSTDNSRTGRDRATGCAEEVGQVDAETIGPIAAAIAHEPKAAAELSVHALDQDASLCSVRTDGIGSGTHGAPGPGPEVAG